MSFTLNKQIKKRCAQTQGMDFVHCICSGKVFSAIFGTVFLRAVVLYLVLSPFLSVLHLAFASHDHRFDLKTGQYLDTILIEEDTPQSVPQPIYHDGKRIGTPTIGHLYHLPCPISNGLLLTYTSPNGISKYHRTAHLDHCESIKKNYHRPQLSALINAPKQSPPSIQS